MTLKENLYIGYIDLQVLPEYFSNYKEIDFSCNYITSLNQTTFPICLKTLVFSHNQVNSLSDVKFPNCLTDLCFRNNKITSFSNTLSLIIYMNYIVVVIKLFHLLIYQIL